MKLSIYINNYKNNFNYYINPFPFILFFEDKHQYFADMLKKILKCLQKNYYGKINTKLSIKNETLDFNDNSGTKEHYNYLKKSEQKTNYIMNDLFYICYNNKRIFNKCNKVSFFKETFD